MLKLKQINLEIKDFKTIYKALQYAKSKELECINEDTQDPELKKYRVMMLGVKYDALIERVKSKTKWLINTILIY